MSSAQEITELLRGWNHGDQAAFDELARVVYRDLRQLAARHLRMERPGHTLQPTALVNEAYLRLIGQTRPDWRSRAQFFGVAAHIMRQILVDHARRRKAAKRGGEIVTIQRSVAQGNEDVADLLALDDALKSLERFDARKSKAIELRYFGGLKVEEICRSPEHLHRDGRPRSARGASVASA